MPQLIIPVVISAGALFVKKKIDEGAAEKQAKVEANLVQNLATQDRQLASDIEAKRLSAETELVTAQREQDAQILAENKKLAEQQLVLEASRQKLETLATLESFKQRNQPIVFNAAPQPVRQLSFLDRINLFIQGLF